MHEVLVNRLGGLCLPRKSVVRLTDRPDMTLDVYRGRKTTMQQLWGSFSMHASQCSLHVDKSQERNEIHSLILTIVISIITSYYSYARPAQPGSNRTRLCGLCIAAITGD